MFHIIAATAVKVAVAAVLAPRHANTLGRLLQVHRPGLGTGDGFHPRLDRVHRHMSGHGRALGLLTGTVMTGQTIHRIVLPRCRRWPWQGEVPPSANRGLAWRWL